MKYLKTETKKNTYRDILHQLLERTHPRLFTTHRIACKNFFGAVLGYVDGALFVSGGAFGVALKMPPKTLEAVFKEKGVTHLKYFPKGHIKKEYAVFPKRILEDKKQFKKCIDESIRYVLKT